MGIDIVTGAAGFIGSHMVDKLASRGRNVLAVDSLYAGSIDNLQPARPNVTFIHGDTRDPGWWPENVEISRIFHYAANASVPNSSADPHYDLTANVQGTLRMLELARDRGAQITYISSAAVYGRPETVPTSEQHARKPISFYGVSKLAGEEYVDFFRREHGLDTRTIRYFNIFGPRASRYIVHDFLKKAATDSPTFEILGDGNQIRTQLFVTDAVEATLLVAEKGGQDAFNIGAETPLTVYEIARLVLHAMGIEGKKELRTTGVSWPGDIPILQPDITRLRTLGFTPRISFEQGLQAMIQGRVPECA